VTLAKKLARGMAEVHALRAGSRCTRCWDAKCIVFAKHAWTWPVNVERYDRNDGTEATRGHSLGEKPYPLLERAAVLPFNVLRQARVHRLLDPLEDVFNHVCFQRNRRPAMKILLLKRC